MFAIGGEADGKVHGTTIDDIRGDVEAWRLRQSPDIAIHEAEDMLEEYLSR